MNNLLHYKEKLKLNNWDNNNYISPDMKQFYNDIIDNYDELKFIKHDIVYIRQESDILLKFLKHKNIGKDLENFKVFITNNPYSNDLQIKAFFRKQKIKKILNEQI